MPDVFRLIYETARKIKPDAVVQLCPCGCAMSFYNIPYTNQFVASDPVGSTQVRSKGKTYKALAPNTAYFGDHVELSDNRDDFASTIGVGGVPGTKFTWPKDNPTSSEKNLLNLKGKRNGRSGSAFTRLTCSPKVIISRIVRYRLRFAGNPCDPESRHLILCFLRQ
jgi:hypothetical protein